MQISDYTNRGPGRPRSKKSHKAIITATRELLIKQGVHGLTIEGVAKKAQVGKATIYRHWDSREALISEAIGSITDEIEIPNTGNTWNDFIDVVHGMLSVTKDATQSSNTIFKRILTGVIESPRLMEVYTEQFITPRRTILKQIIEKGKMRGDIRHDVNAAHLIDLIIGSFFYHMMLNSEQLSIEEWLNTMKPMLLKGIAP